ncbi:hypothetical protein, partial [Xanthomonas sp. LMG 9002]|uniref:hypothetical protein n=1 Tax=Xanthomonas sp. LMG 9002 TaxID=1591158 RepID=UPI001F1981B4
METPWKLRLYSITFRINDLKFGTASALSLLRAAPPCRSGGTSMIRRSALALSLVLATAAAAATAQVPAPPAP